MIWQKDHRPAGLKRRITYAFILLISAMAVLSALAVKNAFEFAETTLTREYFSDISQSIIEVLNRGDEVKMPLSMAFYCDAPGMNPLPERFESLDEGYSEVTQAPAVFAYKSQWRGYPFVIVRDQASFEKTEQKMWLFAALTVVAVVVLAVVLGTILSRRIMHPVERLSEAVQEMASGKTYKAIPREIMTNDEVGALAQTCDSALSRLYDALSREKAFTGDVSHELRTPLTVIETSAELLEISDLTDQQSRQVKRILRSVNQMRSLVTLFLQLSRTERNIKGTGSDSVRELFAAVREAWTPEATNKNIELTFETIGRCKGTYSPVLLATVMNNLVKNAVMYVPDGSRIAVIETSEGFMVADNGPGILPSERDKIFNAFMRGSTAKGDGEGLGLSIVARICERLGWTVRLLESRESGCKPDWATGAVFEVVLSDASKHERKDRNPRKLVRNRLDQHQASHKYFS